MTASFGEITRRPHAFSKRAGAAAPVIEILLTSTPFASPRRSGSKTGCIISSHGFFSSVWRSSSNCGSGMMYCIVDQQRHQLHSMKSSYRSILFANQPKDFCGLPRFSYSHPSSLPFSLASLAPRQTSPRSARSMIQIRVSPYLKRGSCG